MSDRVSIPDALAALGRMKAGGGTDADHQLLAALIAERAITRAPSGNTGLPCIYCGERQERLNVERDGEAVNVRISARIENAKDFKGLIGMLKMFAPGR